jgi:hypothetical protein
LAQIPGCGTEGEHIQSASQMGPVSCSPPYLPQWKLERAGTVASDLGDGVLGIISVPAAVTVDQEGRTRVDRQAHRIAQPRSGVQLLQDRGCRPGHLLRQGQWIEYFRCLEKEVPGKADNSKAGAIKLPGE